MVVGLSPARPAWSPFGSRQPSRLAPPPLLQRRRQPEAQQRRCVRARVSQPLPSTDTAAAEAAAGAGAGAAAEAATAAVEAAAGEGQLEQQASASIDELPAVEVPADVLVEFDQRLGEDLQSVAVTLTAVTGVIIFWRGVWSLLDYFLGDSIYGDVSCIAFGLMLVLGIRLSGAKVSSSFWPPS